MDREPVVSSNIRSIGYDEATQTLEIEFANGFIYEYPHVPPSLHQELMDSPSKGKFVSKSFRTGGFACRRIQ